MIKSIQGRLSWIFAFLLLFSSASSAYLSPQSVAVDPAGSMLYVAESTAQRVDIVDLSSETVKRSISLPQDPTGLALTADGKFLYVTGDGPEGRLFQIDINKRRIVRSIEVGHTPMAPVLSPNGKHVYVCNRFDDAIAVVDAGLKEIVTTIAVTCQPVACSLSRDGSYLFVANHLPLMPANGVSISAAVEMIDTKSHTVAKRIVLPNGSTTVRGLCLSPDGQYVYVTHLLSRHTMPTTQLERGWMNTNAVSIIHAVNLEYVNTVLLDDVMLGAPNPWAIACSSDGKHLYVAHAGSHEISVIDRSALHERLQRAVEEPDQFDGIQSAEDVPNVLSFLVDIRRRIELPGIGPRSIAVFEDTAYVGEYFTDSIAVVSPGMDLLTKPKQIVLGDNQPMDEVRRGEMLFNDGTMCFQHWQSCASCHPDGRADGLNWDLLNDGIGNPKSTKSMLFSHETPPVMISGVRPRAEVAVRAGIKFIQFTVRPEEDAVAIDEYLKSLRPAESPYLVDGQLSPAARRGKKIFVDARCDTCHHGRYFTDLEKYDVGLGTGREKGMAYDTPTLVEVWRTAPYLFEGQAATMLETFTKYNSEDQHGVTSDLTTQEIEDLVQYVLSL